ncbi:putative PEP-CTERM system TPR-repeat lipoprotein [Chitinivorax tropicus]|uniref:Putative PEP-CTERM system TPR-repeat lipoprotein n=1 Tax=Chitinivorax tropicus TaxID=714531 RepID=A0A840MM98_9PROT|nr:XrtA/PEP-CTERM system TPR-repeat protein PrsT [Chitinivorax tropicus]MBB5020274.1 putative PEP-CTERM system TPR-repeat lipoprotein [Chitinivorax tropicus]
MNPYTSRRIKPTLISLLFISLSLQGCGDRLKNHDQLVEEARQASAKGDHSTAAINLKSAVEKEPERAQTRVLLAQTLLDSGQAADAEKQLRRAFQINNDQKLITPLLVKTLLAQKNYKGIIEETDIAAGAGTLDGESSAGRAKAYLMLNRIDEAERIYTQLIKQQPNVLAAQIGLAQIAVSRGDLTQATELINSALTTAPNHVEALYILATLHTAKNDTDGAIATYRKIITQAAKEATAYVRLVDLLAARKQFEVAQQEISKLRQTQGMAGMVDYLSAIVAFRQGKLDEARKLIQSADREMPQFVPSMLLAGQIELAANDPQKAANAFQQVLNLSPNDIQARMLLAQAQILLKQPQQAYETLKPALLAAPYSAPLYTLAGEALLYSNDDRQAIAFLEYAAKLAPDSARVSQSLTLSKMAKGGVTDDHLMQSKINPRTTEVVKIINALNAGKLAEAEQMAAKHANNHQDDALMHNLLGVARARAGKHDQARQAFEKALAIRATYYPALVNLSLLDIKLGHTQAAISRFDQHLKMRPGDVTALLGRAEVGLRAGEKPGQIERFLQSAHKANPGMLQPALMLAQLFFQSADHGRAMEYALKARNIAPNDKDVLQILGMSQLASGDRNGAISTLTQWVIASPGEAGPLIQLAKAQAGDNRAASAEHSLRKALEIEPKNIQAHVELALLYAKAGRAADANRKLAELSDLKLSASDQKELQADIAMAAGKSADATSTYQSLYQTTPSPRLLSKLHDALVQAGKVDEAIRIGQTWLQNNPDDIGSHYFLANAASNAKRPKIAAGYYEVILKKNPDDLTALNNAAQAYVQFDTKRAIDLATQAFKLAPENPFVLDTYGWSLLHSGKFKEGIKHIELAYRKNGQQPDIQYHYAVALAKTGDRMSAKERLSELLKTHPNFPDAAEAKYLFEQLTREVGN